MKNSLVLSRKAREDLKSIAKYTHKNWGMRQCNHYLQKLDAAFQYIAEYPKHGMSCDYIREGYHKYHVEKHVVFYRQLGQEIQIVRVLHSRMDVIKHL